VVHSCFGLVVSHFVSRRNCHMSSYQVLPMRHRLVGIIIEKPVRQVWASPPCERTARLLCTNQLVGCPAPRASQLPIISSSIPSNAYVLVLRSTQKQSPAPRSAPAPSTTATTSTSTSSRLGSLRPIASMRPSGSLGAVVRWRGDVPIVLDRRLPG
jgi:hypothetical protein